MSDTTTKASDVDQMDRMMDRMRDLAETNLDVYRLAFYWLSGAGRFNKELGEHVAKAIDYVERTFPQ